MDGIKRISGPRLESAFCGACMGNPDWDCMWCKTCPNSENPQQEKNTTEYAE